MNPQHRTTLSFVACGTLLALIYLATLAVADLPEIYVQLLTTLCYVLLGAAMLLSALFKHSREFNVLLVTGLSFWSIQAVFWRLSGTLQEADVLFACICVLIPFNFVLHTLLLERGILTSHGLGRLGATAIQLALLIWLVDRHAATISPFVLYQPFRDDAFSLSAMPQVGIISVALGLTIVAIQTIRRPSTLQNGYLFAFVAVVLGLHFAHSEPVAALLFAAAPLLIITAVVLNSHNLAYLDDLTGLPSRRALQEALMTLGKRYAIAMVDVDHFKKINDRHGHDVGDQVLRMVAAQIRRTPGSRAFRYGGEEFAVLFAGKNADETYMHLDSLRARIASTPFVLRGHFRPRKRPTQPRPRRANKTITVTVSIGVAQKRLQHNVAPEDVLKSADEALYHAKGSGRNRVMRASSQ